ncbi:unnamed protein product (macronuclear) [Paramecium tetraurelia]|uniref:Receptor expression-enhancing protein n=1 Tax=Paramecium tetraurelia TaxID=5888 RepID=A0C363_PARTE|nr:uncharacterized protein GSPATT00034708001 [Paramecium tetraurelia]CAK65230.1 unnamed protein product [Paramecium tetraurelia]|eukprot:XP_001432627.1 hypothetical protein (macronuclear) [Paramecium tetraurelia strain d4-2]
MLNSQKLSFNDQSHLNEEYVSVIKQMHEIADEEIINRLAQKITQSKSFLRIARKDYDFNLVRLGLYLILILGIWILSYVKIIWLLTAIIYPMKCKLSNEQDQIRQILYYVVLGVILLLDPLLYVIIEKMIPLYGIVRFLMIYWLVHNKFYGCGVLYVLIFKKLKQLDPERIKEDLLDVVDKMSARNF